MKGKGLLTTTVAILCTLALVLGAAAVPALWFRAEDQRQMAEPLTQRRKDSRLAPEGEDLYLVRTLHERNARLAAEGPAAGYQPQPDAQPETLRRNLITLLDDMAKAGVLPAALCSQLAIQVEQDSTAFTCLVDGAGFRQTRCSFTGGSFASFGVECEPVTGRAVNLWVNARQHDTWPTGTDTDQWQGEVLLPADRPPDAASEMAEYPAGATTSQPPGAAQPEIDAAALLQAYAAWLWLDGLDDWAAEDGGYYTLQRVSQKALMQLYIICQGKTLSLGVAPTGGA